MESTRFILLNPSHPGNVGAAAFVCVRRLGSSATAGIGFVDAAGGSAIGFELATVGAAAFVCVRRLGSSDIPGVDFAGGVVDVADRDDVDPIFDGAVRLSESATDGPDLSAAGVG